MDTINDNLSLTVINDGDGSQCGFSYQARCAIFKPSKLKLHGVDAQAALRMVRQADSWMGSRGYQRENAATLLIQAAMVAEYYAEHVTQLVEGA